MERQPDNHCIRLDNIPRTKTSKGETAEARVKCTEIRDRTELTEREELVRKQPETVTSEAHPDVPWSYTLDLARAGFQELQDVPRAAESDASQTHNYVQIPLDITTNYHARAKRFTASRPRGRALAILVEITEAGRMMRSERVRVPRAGMVIHHIVVERADFWVWHEKPRERQPATPSQPPPATRAHRQADFTPRAVGTGATGTEKAK